METFSALLAICAGNSPVPAEFPTQRPVTRSFAVFFDLRLNKRLSKQSWGWWFETLRGPLWRHRNVRHRNKTRIRLLPINPATTKNVINGRMVVSSPFQSDANFVIAVAFVVQYIGDIYRKGGSNLCSRLLYILHEINHFTSSSHDIHWWISSYHNFIKPNPTSRMTLQHRHTVSQRSSQVWIHMTSSAARSQMLHPSHSRLNSRYIIID